MNILLLYPEYPDTFWSFRHALKFISKKAVNPPLGLITISSLLPAEWRKRLIDINVEPLRDRDILWAEMVFISAMSIQSDSARKLIDRCRLHNKKIVAGGPLFTENHHDFQGVDHFVLNEAEITLPLFLKDLAEGTPLPVYTTEEFAMISESPVPDYSLVRKTRYNTFNLQYTRGCPFNCEFCDITALFGHKVRAKTTGQVINELQAIYNTGWRKNILFVDDNFIGNRSVLKNELLPAIIQWMEKNKYPFTFSTEASINLADDDKLLELMAQAGFSQVFIGIETTEEASLAECGKTQNRNRNLVESVINIQKKGIEVSGGFIVGFDNDSPSVFQKQIDFIRESGIISAMVGLLNAPRKTRLYKRLKDEGRIIKEMSGNNTDMSLNFIPKMDKAVLLEGYNKVIRSIYGGQEYYKRVLAFLRRFTPNRTGRPRLTFNHFLAIFRATFRLGLIDRYRRYYWILFLWTLFNRPGLMPLAITYSVYGYHFRKVFSHSVV